MAYSDIVWPQVSPQPLDRQRRRAPSEEVLVYVEGRSPIVHIIAGDPQMREPDAMREHIRASHSGLITYGITPPKRTYSSDRLAEIAATQTERIRQLPIDALVVYDIQDEAMRTSVPRPFPYLECVESTKYALDSLAQLSIPKIVYRCVAPLSKVELLGVPFS